MLTLKEIEIIVQNMKGSEEEKKAILTKVEICRDFQSFLEQKLGLSEEAVGVLSQVYIEEHKSDREAAFKKIDLDCSKDQLTESMVEIIADTMRGFANKYQYPKTEEFIEVIKGFIRAKVVEEV
jgi:hypothetical protein